MNHPLFQPATLGPLALPNRIVMAPMTRSRADAAEVPSPLAADYYAQRAGAGLIVTEATQVGSGAQGYSGSPGLYTAAQIAAWRRVTDAVHAAGGRIAVQLWHTGRVSHPAFHGGQAPAGPSAIKPVDTQVWLVGDDGVGRMVEVPVPRALEIDEIGAIVGQFAHAARCAREAGFDLVEIHGANGYLVDQFLQSSSNRRDDGYGGSVENRLRFMSEVVEAVSAAIGRDRVGVRLSPFVPFKDMHDPDPAGLFGAALDRLDALGVAYVHIVEDDWDSAPDFPWALREDFRRRFGGTLIYAGRYDLAKAQRVLDAGLADLVAFGRAFVANPDLPRRLREGLPLAEPDRATLFGGGAHGYVDYPVWMGEEEAVAR